MSWVLWLVVAAAAAHVAEEFWLPGGFLAAMRRTAPAFAFAATVPAAVVINAMFLAGTVAAAIVGARAPVFALSTAALIAVNGWVHVAGTLRERRYLPGVMTGLLVNQPVAALAYLEFAHAGLLTGGVLAASLLLGAGYHLVPGGYFGFRWLVQKAGAGRSRLRHG